MDGYRRVVEVLKSLGHPIRLQIMEILSEEGEACVCHLEYVLGLRQAYISQQLARLREAGLIENRRDGLNIFYSLKNDKSIVCVEDLKEMVVAISRDGGKLKFERSRKKTSASCPCPSCREKRLASSTFLTTLRERIISIRR